MNSTPHAYAKDFWKEANRKFNEPHFRTERVVGIAAKIARGRECDLLDVGCGPAAVSEVLPSNIHYYGIDIATQDHGAANLREADLRTEPIQFGSKRFDIVLAQGFFEYVEDTQAQKFAEIADVMKPDGKFIVTYWNFGHRAPHHYHAISNIQSITEFRRDLARRFRIDSGYPVSHNWRHRGPSRRIIKMANKPIRVNVPLVSPKLAVEYVFVCSRQS
jgi:SAM-dependent methyltransferase